MTAEETKDGRPGGLPMNEAVPSSPTVGIPDACNVPPPGWRCTRAPGHDGPCAALPDEVVGHLTLEDGKHEPLYKRQADALWASIEEARERRERMMPDEMAAIRLLNDAYTRLKDFGWKDPVYTPKDGSALDLIEAGSTGIHRGHYEGKWPTGSWWIHDGDTWPSRPTMARAAQGMETRQGGNEVPSQSDDSPVACDAPITPIEGTSHAD